MADTEPPSSEPFSRADRRHRFSRAVLDGIELGVITTDGEGLVTFVNRAAATTLGEASRHLGRDVRDVLSLGEAPAAILGDAHRVTLTHALALGEGRDLDLELSIARADDAAHARIGFFFIFRDLSPDRQREEEQRRLERLAAMGTMVAGFAHEVRNPVAALRSLAESLAEDLADVELHMPQIGRMLDVLARIERLVQTSLQFGRPDPPRRGAHRPWALISRALGVLASRTRASGSEVRVEVEPELPDVVVDEGQMVQVLVILLDNAIDATGDPGRVLVRARSSEEPRGETAAAQSMLIEVHDDGPGVPASIAERIYDPFFTTKAAGTGLGLSIAQQLVAENGGRLDHESTRGATTFRVAFRRMRRVTPAVD